MKKKQIKLLSGAFDSTEQTDAVDERVVDRKAMLVYAGEFESMDGPVEIKDEDIDKLASEHNTFLSRLGRLATGEIPLKHMPPIQLDHSTSARDTVGRLVGNLEIGEHEVDGLKRKALFGTVRVLGKENVEKVKDGRWTNLSIGADLEKGKLTELTITPFPAAPDASLLKGKIHMAREKVKELTYKGKKIVVWEDEEACYATVNGKQVSVFGSGDVQEAVDIAKSYIDDPSSRGDLSKGEQMYTKLKAFLMSKKKLSAEAADAEMAQMNDAEKEKVAAEQAEEEKKAKMAEDAAKHEKMKKHLMDKEKLADEAVEKKLAEMDDEGKKKLEGEIAHKEQLAAEEEEKKKLAGEGDKEKLAAEEKEADKKEMSRLQAALISSKEKVQLAAKKSNISIRMSKLKAMGKLTPAEIKQHNSTELAKKSDEALELFFEGFEKRQPVIMTGVVGNANAEQVSKVAEKKRMSSLAASHANNMPFLKRALENQKRLSKEGVKLSEGSEEASMGAESDENTDMASDEVAIEKMMDSDPSKAKEMLKAYCKKMRERMTGSDAEQAQMSDEAKKSVEELAEESKKMQTHLEDMLKLSSKISGIKL
jgi:hypothetical protein